MNKYICGWIPITLLMFGCNGNIATSDKNKITGNIYCESLFGETYIAQGVFLNDQEDNIETNLWVYTNLDTPLVLYGNYSNGMPVGIWNFGPTEERVISSQWNIYKNSITPCSFSVPFKFEEVQVDSSSFKLRTMNDSLGKITVVVQISNQAEKEENLSEFVLQSEKVLHAQGYTFTSNKREIKRNENRYFFNELYKM